MMDDWPQISGVELAKGVAVVYVGADIAQPYYFGDSAIAVLRKGHPGRILDPDRHHVRVTWVALEDEPISYGSGFSLKITETDPDGIVPGLRRISEPEYEILEGKYRAIAEKGRE